MSKRLCRPILRANRRGAHLLNTGEPQPSLGCICKKVILSIWSDSKELLPFKLLSPKTNITAQLYCQQPYPLAGRTQRKCLNHRPIHSLHENPILYIANITHQRLLKLGWEECTHPPYSLDLAPFGYHLFLFQNSTMQYKTFSSEADLYQWLADLFAFKPKTFYCDGNQNLREAWHKMIGCASDYFNQIKLFYLIKILISRNILEAAKIFQ